MRRATAGLNLTTEAKQISSDQAVTPAPWSLHGHAFLLPTLKVSTVKQYDVNPLHGAKHWGLIGAVILVKYPETSIGPYSELIFTSGFHISQIYVDSQASVNGGRANWAVPKKLATFDWQTQGGQQHVKVSRPNTNQPFFTASFKQSQFSIPASSVVVPPPLKTILQACDPHVSNSKYLSTKAPAWARMAQRAAALSSYPGARFSSAIEAINDRLEQYADGRKQVKFLDCSSIFIEDNAKLEGGQKIRLDHMPDVLHPNAAGMEQLLTTCLDPALGLKPLELSE
ncbi:MAG: hypothetical protein FRX49_00873 [Trebouxia sp. A1-2]|nr:MAG: hypothetical protein FRX49_00873 [Trebouxia sp. A1-2]